jgi:hypothetical protein
MLEPVAIANGVPFLLLYDVREALVEPAAFDYARLEMLEEPCAHRRVTRAQADHVCALHLGDELGLRRLRV